MSRLDDLIEKYCPDGVEYRALGEVCNVSIGEFVHKSEQSPNYEYPVFNGGRIPTGFYNKYNRNGNKVIISARGNAGFVNRVLTKFWAGNSCYTLNFNENILNWNYVYHYLKMKETKFFEGQQKGGIPAVSKKQVEDFLVPLPPLPVQEEIVRILDTFTELEKELEKELVLRRKQYEYYRDLLLDFGHGDGEAYSVPWLAEMLRNLCPQGVEYRKLGKVIQIKRGIRLIKKQLKKDGLYPVYQNSSIPLGYHDNYNCGANTTMIITAGAAGEVLYSNKRFWAADDCFYFICDERINEKFLYYILTSQQKEIYTKVRKASIPRLPRIAIENIIISLPPLAIQRRITAILDRFDALCNDLTSGLPAEIALRRKQYEYYRDKLLTFKELKEV